MIPIPVHNLTLNHDSGSNFNVELIPRVIIQRGIKTRGHNSTGGPNFIRRRGRNSMTPCLWGRNSTWKIRWILSTARWIKTPRVEIQWGQNSILHRNKTALVVFVFYQQQKLLYFVTTLSEKSCKFKADMSSYFLNIKSIFLHPLLWKSVMLDFICKGLAELWATGSKRKNQTENMCLRRESLI